MKNIISIKDVSIGGNTPVLVAGPCALESADMAMQTAQTIAEIADKMKIPYIFKGSYDKANRLSIDSGRGLGFPKGLEVLRKISENIGVPVLTDIHESYQVEAVASVADILQIPAFLCRQTDLLIAAANAKKPINIKKGQFLAPEDMKSIAEKAIANGNDSIILTERGTTFGYRDLILDPRSIIILKGTGFPVLLDVTHLCQKPGAGGGHSSGDRKFVIPFARVGIALAVHGIYMEVHPDPENAISDRDVQMPLSKMPQLLKRIFE